MIKFFRKIRQKLLSENKFSKYIIYAIGEILLVVIGILIAVNINNWNEEQKKLKEEIEILNSIKIELEKDKEDLLFNSKDLSDRVRFSNNILNAIETKKSYDSLYFQLGRVSIYTSFVHSNSTFETLKARGITLIRNKKLRDMIIYVYDAQYKFYISEEEKINQYSDYGIREIYPTRLEEYMSGSSQWEVKPLSLESLKDDREFIYFIKTQKNKSHLFSVLWTNRLLRYIDELLKSIDLELQRLEVY